MELMQMIKGITFAPFSRRGKLGYFVYKSENMR